MFKIFYFDFQRPPCNHPQKTYMLNWLNRSNRKYTNSANLKMRWKPFMLCIIIFWILFDHVTSWKWKLIHILCRNKCVAVMWYEIFIYLLLLIYFWKYNEWLKRILLICLSNHGKVFFLEINFLIDIGSWGM